MGRAARRPGPGWALEFRKAIGPGRAENLLGRAGQHTARKVAMTSLSAINQSINQSLGA